MPVWAFRSVVIVYRCLASSKLAGVQRGWAEMPSSGCYFGCGTLTNRVRWAAFAGLLLIALGLATAAGVLAQACSNRFDDIVTRHEESTAAIAALSTAPEELESLCRDSGFSEDSPECIEKRARADAGLQHPVLSSALPLSYPLIGGRWGLTSLQQRSGDRGRCHVWNAPVQG